MADGPLSVEEQLDVQELLERERAAERAMQARLRRCKWALSLEQSLWGERWARHRRLADEPAGGAEPPAADGDDCCPVCLYPPLPQQRTALACCGTIVCAKCIAPLECCPICRARVPVSDARSGADSEGLPRSQDDEVYCAERRRVGACKCSPIAHAVTAGDSAFSIALRYRTTTDQLLQANLMRGTGPSELAARANVKIPVCMVPSSFVPTPRHVLEENQKAASLLRFQKATRAGREEALFYLEDASWSLQLALQAHSDDTDWERQQGDRTPLPPA